MLQLWMNSKAKITYFKKYMKLSKVFTKQRISKHSLSILNKSNSKESLLSNSKLKSRNWLKLFPVRNSPIKMDQKTLKMNCKSKTGNWVKD